MEDHLLTGGGVSLDFPQKLPLAGPGLLKPAAALALALRRHWHCGGTAQRHLLQLDDTDIHGDTSRDFRNGGRN